MLATTSKHQHIKEMGKLTQSLPDPIEILGAYTFIGKKSLFSMLFGAVRCED